MFGYISYYIKGLKCQNAMRWRFICETLKQGALHFPFSMLCVKVSFCAMGDNPKAIGCTLSQV